MLSNDRTFSYSRWHAWLRLPGVIYTALVFGFIVVQYRSDMNVGQLVAYCIAVVVLTAFLIWLIRFFVLGFTQPHVIQVTDLEIEGRPILGSAVRIAWDEIAAVRQGRPFLLKIEETQIRAREPSRRISFNEELPGYGDLRAIVLHHVK